MCVWGGGGGGGVGVRACMRVWERARKPVNTCVCVSVCVCVHARQYERARVQATL